MQIDPTGVISGPKKLPSMWIAPSGHEKARGVPSSWSQCISTVYFLYFCISILDCTTWARGSGESRAQRNGLNTPTTPLPPIIPTPLPPCPCIFLCVVFVFLYLSFVFLQLCNFAWQHKTLGTRLYWATSFTCLYGGTNRGVNIIRIQIGCLGS